MRTLSRAPRIVAITRATRPEPPLRTTVGASTTATSNSSGAKLNRKSRSELEWKRSVEDTMRTPSSTSAPMLSTLCETRVPSSTGNVSRIRPVRRASTIARAGSPRRAGRVADISTPTIVAEATSRRRSGRRGSAARAIENQELARRNIEAIISAVAIRTQPMSERTMLVTTRSTPIRCAAMKVSPTPIAPATPIATRRAVRWRPPAIAGAGSRLGSLRAGTRSPPSAGRMPTRREIPSDAVRAFGAAIASR